MTTSLNVPELVIALGEAACRFDIDVLPRCDSTNAVLMSRAEMGAPSGSVVVAEEQTAGRGRRGRAWIAAPGDSLTFSVLWRFAPGTLPMGLSLAAGVAVARALEKMLHGSVEKVDAPGVLLKPLRSGLSPQKTQATPLRIPAECADDTVQQGMPIVKTALKWPNDILLNGKKLGGILIELVPGAPHAAVIGIGINHRLPAALPPDVRATAAALGDAVDSNALLAALLIELLSVLKTFSQAGFAALRLDWLARHAFQDVSIVLLADFSSPRQGICRGVDNAGALLLEANGHIERVLSGEISLRAATSV